MYAGNCSSSREVEGCTWRTAPLRRVKPMLTVQSSSAALRLSTTVRFSSAGEPTANARASAAATTHPAAAPIKVMGQGWPSVCLSVAARGARGNFGSGGAGYHHAGRQHTPDGCCSRRNVQLQLDSSWSPQLADVTWVVQVMWGLLSDHRPPCRSVVPPATGRCTRSWRTGVRPPPRCPRTWAPLAPRARAPAPRRQATGRCAAAPQRPPSHRLLMGTGQTTARTGPPITRVYGGLGRGRCMEQAPHGNAESTESASSTPMGACLEASTNGLPWGVRSYLVLHMRSHFDCEGESASIGYALGLEGRPGRSARCGPSACSLGCPSTRAACLPTFHPPPRPPHSTPSPPPPPRRRPRWRRARRCRHATAIATATATARARGGEPRGVSSS
jgi:hypothetical protein